MKRLSVLLIIALFLAGCQLNAAIETDPEPGAPLLTEESLPALTASVPVSETPARTEATAEENDTEPVTAESAASEQATEPPELPRYQYGDTTPTWRPELAENYPADEDCDAALLLEKWLAVEGLTTADLDERGCRQLILASAQPTDGVETITVCYTRNDAGVFLPAEGLDRLHGFIGKKGLCHDRLRDSYTSPAGLWAISSAFGNEPPPDGLKLPWRQVTPNSDWVCDVDSPYYNTWQERGDPDLLDWSDDVEHLENYPRQYAWAAVIEFNRPPDVIPSRGCAIFLHCSEQYTAGCVGLHRADLYAVLQWLDAEEHPYILITGVDSGFREVYVP